MKRLLFALLGISLSAVAAHADWFARLDSDGRLVATAIAVDPNGVMNGIFVTCEGSSLVFTITTMLTSVPDELANFAGAKVTFASHTEGGDPIKFGSDGKPVLLVGDVLAIQTSLSPSQSTLIYQFLSRLQRIDVELVQPELTDDQGAKKIYSLGSMTIFGAMARYCPAVILK